MLTKKQTVKGKMNEVWVSCNKMAEMNDWMADWLAFLTFI